MAVGHDNLRLPVVISKRVAMHTWVIYMTNNKTYATLSALVPVISFINAWGGVQLARWLQGWLRNFLFCCQSKTNQSARVKSVTRIKARYPLYIF